MTKIENLKKEISNIYIDQFKKELGWMKYLLILPIKPSIKDIIIGKKELPEKFDDIEEFGRRKDVIKFVSPDLSNKLFDFMKEKRLEIEKRKTEEELSQLKDEILGNGGNNTGNNNRDNTGDSTLNTGEDDTDTNTGNDPDKSNNSSHNINPVEAGVVTGVGGTIATFYGRDKIMTIDAKRSAENLNAADIRKSINEAIDTMEARLELNPNGLSSKQVKVVNKHIDKLKKGLDDIDDESVDLLKLRYKNGGDFAEMCGLSEKMLFKIEKYADEIGELKALGKLNNTEEITKFLKSKKIIGPDDVVDVKFLKKLAAANDLKKVKEVLKFYRNGSKLTRIAQTLAGALWMDVAFLGLDVRMYFETQKEAELLSKIDEELGKNKMNQATYQLWVGIGSVALEALCIIALCVGTGASGGGWIGALIGLGVGVLATVASIGGDAYYYDVNHFYTQKRESFVRQRKTEVNQAILQGIHNEKEGNTSMNEKFHSYIEKNSRAGVIPFVLPFPGVTEWSHHQLMNGIDSEELSRKKNLSLYEALRSTMFLDELEDGGICRNETLIYKYLQSGTNIDDFKKELSDDEKSHFDEIFEKINKKIEKRMEYISSVFEKNDVITAIKKDKKGMQYLTTILNNSKIYYELNEAEKWDPNLSFKENKDEYKKLLFKDYPQEKIEKFEKIKEDNPSLFTEMVNYVTLESFLNKRNDRLVSGADFNFHFDESMIDDVDDESEASSNINQKDEIDQYYDTDENFEKNVKLVVTYKKWLDVTEFGEEKSTFDVTMGQLDNRFLEGILRNDFDYKGDSIEWLGLSDKAVVRRVTSGYDMSEKVNFDISNDAFQNILYRLAKELYNYTGANDELSLMEFFCEGKKNSYGIYYDSWWRMNRDWRIDENLVTDMLHNDKLHESDVEKCTNEFMDIFYRSDCDVKGVIDTATESIDEELAIEFTDKLRTIVREELHNHTVENKDKVRSDISDFVKRHSKGNYLYLPHHLVIEAKRAGLGDIRDNYFKADESGNIEVCHPTLRDLNSGSILEGDKSFVTLSRTEYTEEEQYYIDRVDRACNKLKSIRGLVCDFDIRGHVFQQKKYRFEDELDIPAEIEDIINGKENEWKDFKENILLYNNNLPTTFYPIYEEFENYFENMYRGMLLLISTFNFDNDIDDIDYFLQAVDLGNRELFDDKGKLLGISSRTKKDDENEYKRNKLVKMRSFQNFYNEQINAIHVGDKTIKELRNSDDDEDKKIAKQASTIIYTTTLETMLLDVETLGSTTHISVGGGVVRDDSTYGFFNSENTKDKREAMVKKMQDEISTLKKGVTIDSGKILTKIGEHNEEKRIIKLEKPENESTDISDELHKQILKTNDNIKWDGERGGIMYNPKNKNNCKVFQSWENETEIDEFSSFNLKDYGFDQTVYYVKLKGLDFDLPLEDGIWLANFRNWLLYKKSRNSERKYKDVKYTRSVRNHNPFAFKYTLFINGTQLITRTDLEGYVGKCVDGSIVEKIAHWLNQ